MTEKLDTKLVAEEIKQTCSKKQKLVFRDSAIDKVDPKKIYSFEPKKELINLEFFDNLNEIFFKLFLT